MKTNDKYKVTFNMDIGDYEVGDTSANSVDYVGNDIQDLVREVIENDLSFPILFVKAEQGSIVGTFVDVEDQEDVVAVMYR